MYDKGFEVDFNISGIDAADRAIKLLGVFILPTYYNFKNLAELILGVYL